MNINVSVPTKHQLAVAASHTVAMAGGALSALFFAGVLTQVQVNDATGDINRIVADLKDLYGALSGLVAIAMVVYSTVKSGPLASFFRAATTISQDPKLTEQVRAATLNEKAPIVAITDTLPEVAGVATTNTQAGKALATAVPSSTVQVAKPVIIFALLLGSLLAFAGDARAQGAPRLRAPAITGNPIEDLKTDFGVNKGANTPPALTGNIEKDAQALWKKIAALTKADIGYAMAKAKAANTNASTVRLLCLQAISDANDQANGAGLKNPDGTDMVRPDPALVTQIEDAAELVDNLSPQGRLFTSCAGAAQMFKTNTLAVINAIITGAAGIAALPAGL